MKNDGKDFEIVFAKRFVRSMGYRRVRRPSDIETAEDTGDVRLMSRRGVGELRRLSETHGFLRGLVGVCLSLFSFLFGTKHLCQKRLGVGITAGPSTTALVATFFSGVHFLSIGVIGEFGRLFGETELRPMYIVDRKVGF